MAVCLPPEDRKKIKEYISGLDYPDLTGAGISELVYKEFGIRISQPTSSSYKREIMDERCFEENPQPMGPDDLRNACRVLVKNEGLDILLAVARTGSPREKLEAVKILFHYGFGEPQNSPYFR